MNAGGTCEPGLRQVNTSEPIGSLYSFAQGVQKRYFVMWAPGLDSSIIMDMYGPDPTKPGP